jgi:cysteine-rich repeat protein
MRTLLTSVALFLFACDPNLPIQPSLCGDQIQDNTEACDDGNTTSGDGCDALCVIERCGDGIPNNNGEACDDGNNVNTDTCRNACLLPACGDGVIDSFGINPEACDDGNTLPGDGCDASCQSEVCGDGVVSVNEDCDDGNTTDLDSCPADCTIEPFAGNCDATFPGSVLEDFQHGFTSGATVLAGSPNHQIRDIVVKPGEAGTMLARFTYGLIDKDLEDERVEVWIQTCPGWESLGIFVTNKDGFIQIPIAATLPKGDYSLKAVVLGDGTIADGFLAVWPKNTQVIISDIDGTLTTSDFELFTDLLLGLDADMFPDANNVIQTWATKNYRLVYITGRPQLINRYSRDWLQDHGFPRGVVTLTNDNTEVIPNESGVQEFKAGVMNDLLSRIELHIVRAYGNATTDIGAYNDVGIPKVDTFIIGPNAGVDNTVALTSYTEHLPTLATIPDAVQP